MNHLQHETSPYLLQHAHNPVDWYAWKPEAFAAAHAEDKPILVSIGYSTCHWCHVMERESFEDGEVADYMNSNFVCIKVDREERPDVDQIYMEACQIMTGGGGWPLNCFLMPDGRPFYAGTYFPPMPAFNRPSWLQVLMNIAHAWQNRRSTLEEQANHLTDYLRKSGEQFSRQKLRVVTDESPFTPALLHRIFEALRKNFDAVNGGFGTAPKFPGSMALRFCLHYHYFFGEKAALDHVTLSLDRMILGGIYDQIGGGFARYTTDAAWLVPHFEKMLYDNALLVSLLADAYKFTKSDLYREAIEETLDWVRREMTNSEGGFYSALDADSEGVEGKFYVWDKSEIDEILQEEAALFCEFYQVTEEGNWEEKNILNREKSVVDFAAAKDKVPEDVKNRLNAARRLLLDARNQRIRPGLDDKILLDWNALMATAYAKAYSALGHESYREAAIANVDFLLKKFAQAGSLTLYHTGKGDRMQYDAFLDDYAFLIEALLEVAEISHRPEYLLQAGRYIDFVIEHFLDEKGKSFYFTSAVQKDVLLRRKDYYDSATPSGNSVMVRNLQRTGLLLDRPQWRQLATEMLLPMQESMEKYPSSLAQWAIGIGNEIFPFPEIAVVGSGFEKMAKNIQAEFLPDKILMAAASGNDHFPLLEGKVNDSDTSIYVCSNFACEIPVGTLEEFRQLAAYGQRR